MTVITTLNLLGRTEEALTFYKHAVGCETVFLMRFKDSPDQTHTVPGYEDLIFHARFKIDGTVFIASDVGHQNAKNGPKFEGFAFALSPAIIEQGRVMFDALSEGGTVIIPLEKSNFTGWYGIVQDKFGLSWKIVIANSD